VALCGIRDNRFAESTLDMGKAHRTAVEIHIKAMNLSALAAEFAPAARPAWADGDAIARLEALHGITGAFDHAGHFMANDHRLFDARRAKATVVIIVQVGSANATPLDAHCDLGGALLRLRRLNVFNTKITWCMYDNGLHGRFLKRIVAFQ